MGKVTLYHPASLHVIRGSAEFGGFRFGRIRQLWAEPEHHRARYEATVDRLPEGAEKRELWWLQSQLSYCFLHDIHVYWLHWTANGKLKCHIQVDLNVAAQVEEMAEDMEHEIWAQK